MAASSDRIARKMTYEKERRERISQLFKDLAETLIDSGLPQEAADTQVEALESAIGIVKKWKARKCEACCRRERKSPTSPLSDPALPDFSLSSEPDMATMMTTSRSSSSASATMSTSSSHPSLKASLPDMARRHSSDVTNAGLESLNKNSLKRRRSFETIPQDDDETVATVPKSKSRERKSPPRKGGKAQRPAQEEQPEPVQDMIVQDVPTMDLEPRTSADFAFGYAFTSGSSASPMISVYPPAPEPHAFTMQSMVPMTNMSYSTPATFAAPRASYSMAVTSSTPYLSHSDSFEGSAEFVEDMRLIDRMDFYSDSDDL